MQVGQSSTVRVHVGQRRFKQEVCGCFDNTKLCLPSFFLFTPCVTAQVMGRVKFFPCGGNFSTSRNVLIAAFFVSTISFNIIFNAAYLVRSTGVYFLLECLAWGSFIVFLYMLNSLRQFVRLKNNIHGDGCSDCTINFFCACCSVAQLAAEVDVEDPCSLSEPSEYIAPTGSAGNVVSGVHVISPQALYISQQPVVYQQQPVIYAQAVPAAEVGQSKNV